MKNIIAIVCLGLILLSACSRDEHIPSPQNYLEGLRQPNATPQPQQSVQAQVISATPNYREVPDHKQECRMVEVPVAYEEQVQAEQEVPNDDPGHPVIGSVIGALVGAAIGNQVGNGGGREVARAAGIFTGLAVGNRIGSNPPTKTVAVMQTVQRTRMEQQQQCEEVAATKQEVAGYTVTYNYQGQILTTTMPNDPGQYVTILAAR